MKTYKRWLNILNQAVVFAFHRIILYLFERRLKKNKRNHQLMRIRGKHFDITAVERRK